MVERAKAGAARAATIDPAERAAAARRKAMLNQVKHALRVGGTGLQGAAVIGVRALMPLIEAYSAQRVQGQEGGDAAGAFGLKRGEELVLKAGAQKAFLELVEIASTTHPVYPNAPAFVAYNAAGAAQTPHLVHLLALAAAAKALLGEPGDAADGDDGNDEPAAPQIPAAQSVLFMPLAPGEYAVHAGPLTPREIRRMAMRQRSYTPPQPARLVSAANARTLVVGPAPAGQPRALQGRAASASGGAYGGAAYGSSAAASYRSVGCGCGGRSGCARCARLRQFAPARYDADGRCAPVTDVSCDTRWRVRDCFKVALCDLLRCLGEQMCDENGRFDTVNKPDYGACLETFVCSIVSCLPDAICPPPQRACCPAPDPGCGPASDDCNYAVGE